MTCFHGAQNSWEEIATCCVWLAKFSSPAENMKMMSHCVGRKGENHTPGTGGPALYLPNHTSHHDTPSQLPQLPARHSQVRGEYLMQAPKAWGGLRTTNNNTDNDDGAVPQQWSCDPRPMALVDPPPACQRNLRLLTRGTEDVSRARACGGGDKRVPTNSLRCRQARSRIGSRPHRGLLS